MNILDDIVKSGLTVEEYDRCLQFIIDKKNGDNKIDWNNLCTMFNLPINASTLRKANSSIFGGAFVAEYYRNYKNKVQSKNENDTSSGSVGSELNINKDGTYSSNKVVELDNSRLKDKNYLLEVHGFSPNEFDVVAARNTIREVVKNRDSKQTLYASYITVKPKENDTITLEHIEKFFDRLDRNYSLPTLSSPARNNNGNKMLLIDIADLHMNLQTSILTTGNEYNCDVAESLFFYVINNILDRTKNYNFDEINFIIGGDMLNSDGLSGTTTKGTSQDNDVSYYDAYERLCAMTIKAIDLLKNICRVNVIYVMGNHDEVTGFKLAKYIDAWFRNEDSVYVDYKPNARKYKLYGRTLLAFAHDGKVNKLPAVIANEARVYWSHVDTVEVFLQHLHHEEILVEDNNMRIQRLPTISPNSKWSMDKGFGAKRQCKSFVFDKKYGMIEVLYTPIVKEE